MNAEQFLAHFERIADAPDAVARLRRFILDLAVGGKLVPQDPTDKPALDLLKQIAKKKARLVQSGRKGNGKSESSDLKAPPFKLPPNWTWTTFGNVHQLIRGVTYSESDVSEVSRVGYVPVLRANNIGTTLTHDEPVYVNESCVSADQLLRAGDFMIALSSGSKNLVGKAAFVPDDCCEAFGGFCGVIRLVDQSLQGMVRVFLQSDLYRRSISGGSRGIGINNLKKDTVYNLPFPLPPLPEQHRIVAKVDELMVLCDRLEAARAGREAARDRLTTASLARLNAPDPETFSDDARFALDALPALTTRSDQIKQLRQTILNLAVRGRLVPQDPTERGPKLPDQTKRMNAENKLSIDIPINWSWARVSEVASARLGKMLDKAKNHGDRYPYLRNTNVHWFEIRTDDIKEVPLVADEVNEYLLKSGDVLICEGGHGIGRSAVWRGNLRRMTFQKALHRVRPGAHLAPDFFAYCCFVYFHDGVMQTHFTGVGIPHFTGKALAQLLFPLPPLAEQHRIVAKVNALMALCDRLETSLAAAAATCHRLLNALLAEALAPVDAPKLKAAE